MRRWRPARHARPGPSPAAPAPARCSGLRIPTEGLAIGVELDAGTVVLRLDGRLDREARDGLLRVARRVVRSGRGAVVVDCAALAGCDDAGLDALASLRRLPEVASVRLVHVPSDVARRLDAAGLAAAPRLRLAPA